jgi:hypothetical protein
MAGDSEIAPVQLSGRFQAFATIVTIVVLAWCFFMFVLPERVVKTVYWLFEALFSVAVFISSHTGGSGRPYPFSPAKT